MKALSAIALMMLVVVALADSQAHEMSYAGGNTEGPRGCVGSPEVTYEGPGVSVATDPISGSQTVFGSTTCGPGSVGGFGRGGGFVPFGWGNSIEVYDSTRDVLFGDGHDIAFVVCLDNDGDRDCHPGPAGNACPDQLFFSHADDEFFHNPLGPLPTSFAAGPGCATEHPFNGYVVFVCGGTHGIGAGAHFHPSTSGLIRAAPGGSIGSGVFASYCKPPAGPHEAPWVAPDPNLQVVWPGNPSLLPYVALPPAEKLRAAGLGGNLMDCGIGNHLLLNLSFSGICFGATVESGWGNGNEGFTDPLTGLPAGIAASQHLTPAGVEGTATLDISDSWFAIVPGFYCQDLNRDGLCGGGVPLLGDPQEPAVDFCDSITLRSGLTGPTPESLPRGSDTNQPAGTFAGSWADPAATVFTNSESGNWALDFDVEIYLGSPANGNGVVGNACGANNLGFGTFGSVAHS